MKMNRPFDTGNRVHGSTLDTGTVRPPFAIIARDGTAANTAPDFSWAWSESLPARSAGLTAGPRHSFHILDFELLK